MAELEQQVEEYSQRAVAFHAQDCAPPTFVQVCRVGCETVSASVLCGTAWDRVSVLTPYTPVHIRTFPQYSLYLPTHGPAVPGDLGCLILDSDEEIRKYRATKTRSKDTERKTGESSEITSGFDSLPLPEGVEIPEKWSSVSGLTEWEQRSSSSFPSPEPDSQASGDAFGRGMNIEIPEECLWWDKSPPPKDPPKGREADAFGVGGGGMGSTPMASAKRMPGTATPSAVSSRRPLAPGVAKYATPGANRVFSTATRAGTTSVSTTAPRRSRAIPAVDTPVTSAGRGFFNPTPTGQAAASAGPGVSGGVGRVYATGVASGGRGAATSAGLSGGRRFGVTRGVALGGQRTQTPARPTGETPASSVAGNRGATPAVLAGGLSRGGEGQQVARSGSSSLGEGITPMRAVQQTPAPLLSARGLPSAASVVLHGVGTGSRELAVARPPLSSRAVRGVATPSGANWPQSTGTPGTTQLAPPTQPPPTASRSRAQPPPTPARTRDKPPPPPPRAPSPSLHPNQKPPPPPPLPRPINHTPAPNMPNSGTEHMDRVAATRSAAGAPVLTRTPAAAATCTPAVAATRAPTVAVRTHSSLVHAAAAAGRTTAISRLRGASRAVGGGGGGERGGAAAAGERRSGLPAPTTRFTTSRNPEERK